jgi:hypothetical protein
MTADERLQKAREVGSVPELAAQFANDIDATNVAIHELLKAFQGRADGWAKKGTDLGNIVSNEYLSVVSAIQHSTGVS